MGARPRALVLALCLPSCTYGIVLGIDSFTRIVYGRALTASGFAGNLLGLVALVSGLLSTPASLGACVVWVYECPAGEVHRCG